MTNQKQLTVRMDAKLYDMAREKCYNQFGIGLSPLIKVFLKAFVSQRGVGFYVGDEDLCRLFTKWLIKKRLNKGIKRGTHLPGPYLRDLYELNCD